MKTKKPASSSSIPGSSTHKSISGTGARKGTSAAINIPGGRTLKSISNRQLLSSIRKLSETERRTVLLILVHLVEIDRRKLYLPMGYSSLFELCVKHLGYSESRAVRRIKVSRCIRQFPPAYHALASGKVNMTNLATITGIITTENAPDLLSRIAGASRREVDLLVSSRRPKSAIHDRVTPVYVKTVLEVRSDEATGRAGINKGPAESFAKAEGGKNPTATGGGKKPVTSQDSGCGPSVSRHIVLEQRFKISFGVDPGFLKKTERIRSLLSSKHHKKLEFEELFEILMDEYIERHSPEGRISRKTERERRKTEKDKQKAGLDKKKTGRDQRKADREQRHLEKKAGKVSRVARPAKSVRITEADKSSRDSKPAKGAKSSSGTSMKLKRQKQDASRYIPQKVRDEVYARDKGRCAFVAQGGKKCGSKWELQIDHVVPFARGGDNSPSNLRLLCAKHNRLEAERAFGERHMEQYCEP